MMKIIETDVLVIGGGEAGFRAAIGAREKNVSVLLLSKGPLGRCGVNGSRYRINGALSFYNS